ncbi:MAG: hypothetical protein ACKOBP_00100 [Planctomycetia bacterium]
MPASRRSSSAFVATGSIPRRPAARRIREDLLRSRATQQFDGAWPESRCFFSAGWRFWEEKRRNQSVEEGSFSHYRFDEWVETILFAE